MAYSSIVILTGAGISAESGIKTFRAADDLWENHRVEEVASPEGYARAIPPWGKVVSRKKFTAGQARYCRCM